MVDVAETEVENLREDWKFSVYAGNQTRDHNLCKQSRYLYATTVATLLDLLRSVA